MYRIFSKSDCLNPNKKDLAAKDSGLETEDLNELHHHYAKLRQAGIPVENIKILGPKDLVLDTWEFESAFSPLKNL